METVEELEQMMNTLQGQQHALNQKTSRLTAENQEFRQAGPPGLAEIATAIGQAVQTAISFAAPPSSERQCLVDIKGQNQSQNPNLSKDVVWWHGKKGHVSAECWSNPKNQLGSGVIRNIGSKEPLENGTRKGAGLLEQGEQAAVVEPQPQLALVTLWTWHRLKLLSEHRTWIPKVG